MAVGSLGDVLSPSGAGILPCFTGNICDSMVLQPQKTFSDARPCHSWIHMGGSLSSKLVLNAGICSNPVVFIYGTIPGEKAMEVHALAVGISSDGWVDKFWHLSIFHKGDWLRYPVPGSTDALCLFLVQIVAK